MNLVITVEDGIVRSITTDSNDEVSVVVLDFDTEFAEQDDDVLEFEDGDLAYLTQATAYNDPERVQEILDKVAEFNDGRW